MRRKNSKSLALSPAPATEQAYQAIRADILSNVLRPGEPVPFERYAAKLKLSRTPIREATLRLTREGLIEIRPRLGTFVSYLDLRQIREMYEVRGVLEGHAARLAASLAEPQALAELEARLTALKTAGEVDVAALSETGKQVHTLIVDACDNAALMGLIRSLQDHFTRFRSLSLMLPDKVIASHREHLQIVRALRRGNPDEAERLVKEHFEHASKSLVDSLIQRPRQKVTVAATR